jgi:hypothetical protein
MMMMIRGERLKIAHGTSTRAAKKRGPKRVINREKNNNNFPFQCV